MGEAEEVDSVPVGERVDGRAVSGADGEAGSTGLASARRLRPPSQPKTTRHFPLPLLAHAIRPVLAFHLVLHKMRLISSLLSIVAFS